MICWYCHWGWTRQVREIYDRAVADIERIGYDGESAMEYGPAHVVWADENWHAAERCIPDCDGYVYEYLQDNPVVNRQVCDVVKRSLQELAALPEDQSDVCPEDYDEEHPENYPPPAGLEMVK